MRLDRIDFAILRELRKNARLVYADRDDHGHENDGEHRL